MPIPGTGGMRAGDLYVKFNVVLPPSGSLAPQVAQALRGVLPRAMEPSVLSAAKKREEREAGGEGGELSDGSAYAAPVDAGAANAEEVGTHDVSPELRRARVTAQHEAARHSGEAYDDEDEDGGGGGRRGPGGVQCAQQ